MINDKEVKIVKKNDKVWWRVMFCLRRCCLLLNLSLKSECGWVKSPDPYMAWYQIYGLWVLEQAAKIKAQRQQVFWGSFGESIKGATSVPGYSASQQEYWVARLRFVGYSTNTNKQAPKAGGCASDQILNKLKISWLSTDLYWLSTDFYWLTTDFYWLSTDFYWLSTDFYWLSIDSPLTLPAS